MLAEVEALIAHYKFEGMPVEGTLYTVSYVAQQVYAENHPICDAIICLYCDEPRSVSLFHRLPFDEVWHFYAGDPLRLVLLYPDGSSRDVIMGSHPLQGQLVQFVVPANVWQAGHMVPGGRYSLFGCTMAPAFAPYMFIGGTQEQLLAAYPDREADIAMLGCREDQVSMI